MSNRILTVLFALTCILPGNAKLLAQAADNKDEKKAKKEAESFFEDGDYKHALPLYLELHAMDPQNAMYNFCLGVSYLNLAPNETEKISKDRAIPYLEAARASMDMIDIDYYLGQAYHLNYRWDEAIAHYRSYLDSLALREPYYLTPLLQKKEEYARIERQIEMCRNGKILMQDTAKITFTNMGPRVNSSFPDYAPAISADNEVLIFTSRRPSPDGSGKMADDYLYYENIYITYKKNGEWVEAIPISKNINTKKHNASIGLSADAQTLFVYKGGDIYKSVLDGEKWTVPKKLDKTINTPYWETHITMTSAQNTIYFVSDRKGGYGGRDIYKAYLMKDGSWGNVENLGPTINTPFDEEAPFIHPDERHLFFSSNGHNSMGGFDIFYAKLKNGVWEQPKNMGYPINTPGDDIYFTVSSNGKNGYLSTIRNGGLGEKDVFIANMPDTGDVPLTVIRGLIKGKDNRALAAEFIVTDKNTGELVGRYKSNSVSGKYLLVFPPGNEYDVVITAEKYVPHTEQISIPDQHRFYDLFQEIQLTHATRTEADGADSTIGQQIVVRNAFFDIDSVVAVADRSLKTVQQKELAYSYFLGNLEQSPPETKKAIAEKVASIEGVGEKVAAYRPEQQVHLTELAGRENLERHILGFDTVYTTSSNTRTKADPESAALAEVRLEQAYFASREEVDTTAYRPEEYFATQGLKEGVEEVMAEAEEDEEAGNPEVSIEELYGEIAKVNEQNSTGENVNPDVAVAASGKGLKDKKFILSSVYFDFNGSALNGESKSALDKLWAVLDKASNLTVEISGHTCNMGEAVYNQMLSEDRAKAVVSYLVMKGIPANRLSAKGYGAAQPVADNDSPEGRRKNRRTELKILDDTGKPFLTDVSGLPAGVAGHAELRVERAVVCTGVSKLEPTGSGSAFEAPVDRLYYFSNILSQDNAVGVVKHIWYYGDRKMAEVELKYEGPQWRTYSSKRILDAWKGAWKVEVVAAGGRILESTSFTVK